MSAFSLSYFFTIDALRHDDFITHGSLARWVKVRLATGAEREVAEADATLIWNRYETLCDTVLHFLDAELKGQPAALEAQLTRDREQPFRGDGPHLEALPVGASRPEPYTASDASGPSPRQLRQTAGVEAILPVLQAAWRPERDAFAYCPQFTIGLVYELVTRGLTADATALFQFLSEIGQSPAQEFINWSGHHPQGKTFLEMLLTVDP